MTNPFRTDAYRILFRFAGLAAIFYGAFIWCFDSFHTYSALSAWGTGPQIAFSLMLIVGGLVQFIGCVLYQRWTAIFGTFLCLSVFIAAEYSCCLTQPTGTGIPAYLLISGFYSLMMYCTMSLPLPSHD